MVDDLRREWSRRQGLTSHKSLCCVPHIERERENNLRDRGLRERTGPPQHACTGIFPLLVNLLSTFLLFFRHQHSESMINHESQRACIHFPTLRHRKATQNLCLSIDLLDGPQIRSQLMPFDTRACSLLWAHTYGRGIMHGWAAVG